MRFLFAATFAAATTAASRLRVAHVNRPVSKVIKLLQDMRSQLQTEAADDAAVYDKLSCWCKSNESEKSSAITESTAAIERLKAAIEEYYGLEAELTSKLAAGKKANREGKQSLDAATALRMKQKRAFHEEEKDTLQSIGATKQAIIVLSKQHVDDSAASTDSTDLSTGPPSLAQIHAVGARLNLPGLKSYAPQSGQIFGVLKQMKDDFEANLGDSRGEEQQAQSAYEELKVSKEAEIRAGKKLVSQMTTTLANIKIKHSQAELDLAGTKEQLSDDEAFLADLKEKCEASDEQHAARTKSRYEEIAAVEDSIKMLNSDNSFDSFSKTVNSSEGNLFLQLSHATRRVSQREASRLRAAEVLRSAAARNGSKRLALLAASTTRLNSFTRVKAAIDSMVSDLQDQMKDEVAHKDFCTSEFHKNDLETAAAKDRQGDLAIGIQDLNATMTRLSKEMATLGGEIDETTKALSSAGDIRAAENNEFQKAVSDQRTTQQILSKAKARMAEKYQSFFQGGASPGAAHVATSGTARDAGNGPARFAEYSVSGVGGKVIALLDTIISDSKSVESSTITDEHDAQAAYEEFVKDSNRSVSQKKEQIVQKSQAKSSAELELITSKADHAAVTSELEKLGEIIAQLHTACDFVVEQFAVRQKARSEEIEALKQAKAILSGMNE